jgi:type II secretory pathway pseudopilin PulG
MRLEKAADVVGAVGIAVLALLAVLWATQLMAGNPTREMRSEMLLQQVADAALQFRTARQRWPESIAELTDPSCSPGPCTFREPPRDAWGNELSIESTSATFRVTSLGQNGARDPDDLSVSVTAAQK